MSNVIAVRENDRGVHLYCRHVWNKLLVALVDDSVFFRRCVRSAGGNSVGHGIGSRPAFVVLDDDLQRSGQEVAGENQNGKQTIGATASSVGARRSWPSSPSRSRCSGSCVVTAYRSRPEPTRISSVDRRPKTKLNSCVLTICRRYAGADRTRLRLRVRSRTGQCRAAAEQRMKSHHPRDRCSQSRLGGTR